MNRPTKTLEQMAAEAAGHGQPLEISGKPASVCPKCGAAMFIDGVNRTEREIVRYVVCRNTHCGKRYLSIQQPARLLREIGHDDDDSASGKATLTLRRKAC